MQRLRTNELFNEPGQSHPPIGLERLTPDHSIRISRRVVPVGEAALGD